VGDSILDIVVNNEIDLDGYGMKTLFGATFVLDKYSLIY